MPEKVEDFVFQDWLETIQSFPERIEMETEVLESNALLWKYRPNGWSIQQVVHHCADSHMNAFIRFKLAITQDSPEIKPYEEAKWAEMSDVLDNDIEDSLMLLKGLHSRWHKVLSSMNSEDLKKVYVHPEYKKEYSLLDALGTYAWHCNHHLEHVIQAKEASGKYN